VFLIFPMGNIFRSCSDQSNEAMPLLANEGEKISPDSPHTPVPANSLVIRSDDNGNEEDDDDDFITPKSETNKSKTTVEDDNGDGTNPDNAFKANGNETWQLLVEEGKIVLDPVPDSLEYVQKIVENHGRALENDQVEQLLNEIEETLRHGPSAFRKPIHFIPVPAQTLFTVLSNRQS